MKFENFTILAVDDKKENLDLLVHILNEFDVIPAINGKKALDIVADEKIDLILLDIIMPNMDGFEVCKVLKNNLDTKHIPIIFATAKTDEQSIAFAFEAGGNDFISKPLKKAEVLARVKTQLQLKTQIEELEFLASKDSMTGIYNRRKFFELAKPLFEKTNNLYVSMIDIDYFKKINDNFGHDVGDVVIKTMAQTIDSLLPKNSIFARVGGEEFVVILTDIENKDVENLFENIESVISSLEIETPSSLVKFTISNGVAKKDSNTKTIDQLLKKADEALYEAKGSGRNKVIFRS